jgi:hypothetical protein
MTWIGQRKRGSEAPPKLTLGCKAVKLPGLRNAVNLVLVSRCREHFRPGAQLPSREHVPRLLTHCDSFVFLGSQCAS